MCRQQTSYEFRLVGDGGKTAATELFYREEVQLALRNRGMPLEGLSYDITPTGMHYLLVHFDIPLADEATWRLSIGGRVANPISLDLDDIRSLPRVTAPVTMECAGNGRALMQPRAISQPWLVEAVGTARWTGTTLRPILEQAGIAADAVELLFTGVDQGVAGGELQCYQRSLAIEEAMRDEVMLAYASHLCPNGPNVPVEDRTIRRKGARVNSWVAPQRRGPSSARSRRRKPHRRGRFDCRAHGRARLARR